MRVVSVVGWVCVWAALAGFAGLAAAAEFIGVAAALRGDVVRVSAVEGEASVGQLFSGTKIFLGDEIEVASGGRMQIMLVDETVFTLGSGARLVIDEFVYDPASQTGSMTTNITRGAFRFVSGKLAKSSPKAMKVTLPTASLSIRGTQVAGIVEEDGASQVVLVGPGPNNFGASLGAVTVTNSFGSVDLIRPNFATTILPDQPPATPEPATPEAIEAIEASTGEDAATKIAAALGVDSLEVVPAIDTDDDGIPDQIVANSDLGASIASATAGDATVTNDTEILEAVFTALSTAVSEGETGPDDMDIAGINLGAGAAALFGGGAQYLGDTTIDQLRNGGLTGSAVYQANDVAIACVNSGASGCGGSYDVTDTWNFANGTIKTVISNGSTTLDYSGDGSVDTNIAFSMDVTIDYSASGPLGNSIVTEANGQQLIGFAQTRAEYDSAASLQPYGMSQTGAQVGDDAMYNQIDWTSDGVSSVTMTNQGGGSLPGSIVLRSDAYLSNFAIGGDDSAAASTGNIASHEINIEKPDGTTLAEGTVHGMGSQ